MEGVPDLNDHIGVDIVFETIITSRKKKWALKDKKFAERIVQRYGMSMQLMDYFNDSQEIIKREFLVNADALEEEAEERKIINIELKEAIHFFRIMTFCVCFGNTIKICVKYPYILSNLL